MLVFCLYPQAALGGDVFDAPLGGTSRGSPPATGSQSELQDEESDQSDYEKEAHASVAESFSELVGMKCRAPFSHYWGGLSYHNALVFQVEPGRTDEEIPQVGWSVSGTSVPDEFYSIIIKFLL